MAPPPLALLPDREEMKTRCPRPRPTIPGATAWASWIGARRFTSSALSISSDVKLSTRPLAGSAALATTASSGPARSTSERNRVPIGEIRLQNRGVAPELAAQLLELVGAAPADDHPGSACVERSRDRLAYPSTRARDQDAAAGQLHCAGPYRKGEQLYREGG